ncbi:MAG TPA: transposase [Polyangia bacterium]|nr:transposase [Polyangia bacterium]
MTLRVRDHVYNLRSNRCFRVLARSFERGRDKFGFRLNHFSVQGNHVHFVVEANDKRALSRGMQGLAVRMARALNRVMGIKGAVFADHYHARILKTPTEVLNVLKYQLHNRDKHLRAPARVGAIDPRCSWALAEPPTVAPRTWLLLRGWRRASLT